MLWHTQGSGKSLSMVFYAHYKRPWKARRSDRNDLDNQLYGQFSRCKDFLRQRRQQAEAGRRSPRGAAGPQADGGLVTTMQKSRRDRASERRIFVVMADEPARADMAWVVAKKQNEKGELEVKTSIGTARIIRDSLPNAHIIGFRRVPSPAKDRSTRKCLEPISTDIYDMTQAVEGRGHPPGLL